MIASGAWILRRRKIKQLTRAEKDNLAQDIIKALEKYGLSGWFLLAWDASEKEGQTFAQDRTQEKNGILGRLVFSRNFLFLGWG